eukprot:GDKI01019681.1.p1 GENE.GDKI01019681.1~~GDKI01019681.1.p1  ORF type:complete len:345 (+),score=46.34 GDKI01019681.1:94-1128(+)
MSFCNTTEARRRVGWYHYYLNSWCLDKPYHFLIFRAAVLYLALLMAVQWAVYKAYVKEHRYLLAYFSHWAFLLAIIYVCWNFFATYQAYIRYKQYAIDRDMLQAVEENGGLEEGSGIVIHTHSVVPAHTRKYSQIAPASSLQAPLLEGHADTQAAQTHTPPLDAPSIPIPWYARIPFWFQTAVVLSQCLVTIAFWAAFLAEDDEYQYDLLYLYITSCSHGFMFLLVLLDFLLTNMPVRLFTDMVALFCVTLCYLAFTYLVFITGGGVIYGEFDYRKNLAWYLVCFILFFAVPATHTIMFFLAKRRPPHPAEQLQTKINRRSTYECAREQNETHKEKIENLKVEV